MFAHKPHTHGNSHNHSHIHSHRHSHSHSHSHSQNPSYTHGRSHEHCTHNHSQSHRSAVSPKEHFHNHHHPNQHNIHSHQSVQNWNFGEPYLHKNVYNVNPLWLHGSKYLLEKIFRNFVHNKDQKKIRFKKLHHKTHLNTLKAHKTAKHEAHKRQIGGNEPPKNPLLRFAYYPSDAELVFDVSGCDKFYEQWYMLHGHYRCGWEASRLEWLYDLEREQQFQDMLNRKRPLPVQKLQLTVGEPVDKPIILKPRLCWLRRLFLRGSERDESRA